MYSSRYRSCHSHSNSRQCVTLQGCRKPGSSRYLATQWRLTLLVQAHSHLTRPHFLHQPPLTGPHIACHGRVRENCASSDVTEPITRPKTARRQIPHKQVSRHRMRISSPCSHLLGDSTEYQPRQNNISPRWQVIATNWSANRCVDIRSTSKKSKSCTHLYCL
jgi:hypothetical protein